MMYLKILRDDTKKERFINVNHLAPSQVQSLAETFSVCPHNIRVEIFDSLEGVPCQEASSDRQK